jgi:hypothetical protein
MQVKKFCPGENRRIFRRRCKVRFTSQLSYGKKVWENGQSDGENDGMGSGIFINQVNLWEMIRHQRQRQKQAD